ncbi:Cold shock-like protein CspE [Caulifigura coniformis]|uniref:Cold shock-like protein CspE n=1 Tax=Caulifigura coniformis TaxID=2527983 RepID=A0A517SIP4_9PLAN|nr:cold shock and DUF1294 domain-containing protein [Caulifigura coniformis]QDT56003.1 Cold shock-like protein CspE [Caulifigura coniformis]
MRLQGTITEWKDEQGFGFITPSDGGPRVFVHIKSFANRHRRPAEGDIVHFETTSDAQGRARAVSVSFEEKAISKEAAGRPSPVVFPAFFLVIVGAAVLLGRLPVALLVLDLTASLAAFVVYYQDKLAARLGRWRTPESTLHLLALIGGWPGALLAQRLLRHKSSKVSFLVVFWGTVILSCAAHAWCLTPSGASELSKWLETVGASK